MDMAWQSHNSRVHWRAGTGNAARIAAFFVTSLLFHPALFVASDCEFGPTLNEDGTPNGRPQLKRELKATRLSRMFLQGSAVQSNTTRAGFLFIGA